MKIRVKDSLAYPCPILVVLVLFSLFLMRWFLLLHVSFASVIISSYLIVVTACRYCLFFFCSWVEGLSKIIFLSSQGRVKSAYILSFPDLTCGITLNVLFCDKKSYFHVLLVFKLYDLVLNAEIYVKTTSDKFGSKMIFKGHKCQSYKRIIHGPYESKFNV